MSKSYLTQDIFKHAGAGILSAAIQKDGVVMGFCCTKEHRKAKVEKGKGRGTWIKAGAVNHTSYPLGSGYDASEWETSIINRVFDFEGKDNA